jgi:hypothetical protein
MPDTSQESLRNALEELTGQRAPLNTKLPDAALSLLDSSGTGLGYSQLNELLILFGFDRVTHGFYQFLVDGSLEYKPGATIRSLAQLTEGITRFRKVALLFYGNVKYAFKTLSRDAGVLKDELSRLEPIEITEFERRHDPVRPIDPIAGNDTYYLGYLIEAELKARLGTNPNDEAAKQEEKVRLRTVECGKSNHEAYLASDHLDVYVAGAPRENQSVFARLE